MNWDFLITGSVLIFIVLFAISKITKLTLKEMIEYVKDIAGEGRDEVEERVDDIVAYE